MGHYNSELYPPAFTQYMNLRCWQSSEGLNLWLSLAAFVTQRVLEVHVFRFLITTLWKINNIQAGFSCYFPSRLHLSPYPHQDLEICSEKMKWNEMLWRKKWVNEFPVGVSPVRRSIYIEVQCIRWKLQLMDQYLRFMIHTFHGKPNSENRCCNIQDSDKQATNPPSRDDCNSVIKIPTTTKLKKYPSKWTQTSDAVWR